MNDDARTQDHWGPLRANWEQSLGFTTTAIDVVKSIANANEARENPIGWTVEHLTSVVELAPATADWVSGHFTANETFNSWVHGIIWGKDLAVFAAMAFAPEVTLPAAALGFVELGLSTSSVIEDLSERQARAIRIDATSPSAETHPSAGSTNDGSRTTEQASSQSTSLVCETTEGGAYSSRPEIVAQFRACRWSANADVRSAIGRGNGATKRRCRSNFYFDRTLAAFGAGRQIGTVSGQWLCPRRVRSKASVSLELVRLNTGRGKYDV